MSQTLPFLCVDSCFSLSGGGGGVGDEGRQGLLV